MEDLQGEVEGGTLLTLFSEVSNSELNLPPPYLF